VGVTGEDGQGYVGWEYGKCFIFVSFIVNYGCKYIVDLL
jgi:hypothetical protein